MYDAQAAATLSGIPHSRIVVRRMEFAFGEAVPRLWFGGSRLHTHLANGMNFVFPAGEQFFVRSVVRYRDQVQDPALRQRIDAFVGQEALHGRAHRQSFAMFEAQGLEVQSWIDWYERVAYERLEPNFSPAMSLATTAALEHFTAIFGELVFDSDLIESAHPTMQALLKWHAAEEIEHRDVAFDVFEAVDGRWTIRVAGFVNAGLVLGFFWASAARHLFRQEPPGPAREREARREAVGYWARNGWRALKRAIEYVRPGFHPKDAAIDHLAAAYLSSIGRLAG